MFELPPFLANSTLPQWLIATFTGGTFVAVLRFVIQWRGQSLANDRAVAERIAQSEQQIRDHYANEVATLRQRLDEKDAAALANEERLRSMLEEEERRHDECREDRDRLRARIGRLENELDGIKRQIPGLSADRLLVMEGNGDRPSKVAPHATASAERVKGHANRREGE